MPTGTCRATGCRSDADCSGTEACDVATGSCQPTGCRSDADCPGTERCDGPTGTCVAGTGCTSDIDCETGFTCDGATGICEPPAPEPKGFGEPCASADECVSGLCELAGDGRACTDPCDDRDPSSCEIAGYYCVVGEVCGEGHCAPGTGGTRTDGLACATDLDCESLRCDAGVCAAACVPADAGTACSDGRECRSNGVACGSCVEDVAGGGLGAPCVSVDDCLTEECVVREDGGFCTNYCDAPSHCPIGYRCSELAPDLAICEADPEAAGAPTEGLLIGGCGCEVPGAGPGPGQWLGVLVVLLVPLRRRRPARRR